MKNLGLVFEYIKKLKWMFVLSIFLVILESVANLSMIGLQKWLIDDVLLQQQYGKLFLVILLFAIAFIGYAIMFTVSPYVMRKNEIIIHNSLQERMLSVLQKISMADFLKNPTTQYLHKFNDDVAIIADTIALNIPQGIQSILTVVLLTGIIGYTSPVLLLIVFLISVIYYLVSTKLGPKGKKISREVQENKSALFVHIEEGVSSTREVVAYHRRQWELKNYNRLFERLLASGIKEVKFQNKLSFLTDPLKWGANLAVLGYGAFEVIQGNISIGLFVVIYQYTSKLVQGYQDVFNFVIKLYNRKASIDRINDVLNAKIIKDGSLMLEEPIQSIALNEVDFAYQQDSHNVLQSVSMKFPVGQKIAIVGPSGCGKSTIAKLLVRLYAPSTGVIKVNKTKIQDIRTKEWLGRVAMVSQEPYFFPDTIRMNLIMGLEAISEEQLRMACKVAQIDSFIKELPEGYDTMVGERGVSLSGGQRQRLAIARAILKDPDILILDESTSALDVETESSIQKGLDKLRQGRTTIVIAHRLSTIENADIIYVMQSGQVIGCGTHEELMNNSTQYKKLFTAQVISA
ncbi:ABC transporter ATP-binding protein [Bacillus cereus group sp. N21]|uniref:ABC transporter ATP-binding protein n=1 Tax=Bacillus cereus group sp. N21 TaxID=2794591 RepID=UPI0018F6454C|nr:ABC transporter ATP-binding protein [Bacillus cereus group sp. N21]MBJ8030427.1 ABC transporter ATP-binding protein [Bacillus cereus group sp. N21]